MGLYKRKGKDGKTTNAWRWEFTFQKSRYRGGVRDVSRTVAKELYKKHKAQAIAGVVEAPSAKREKVSPMFATEKLLSALPARLVDDGSFSYRFLAEWSRRKRSHYRDKVAVKALGGTLVGRRLTEISRWLIDKHRDQREKQGRTPATVNRELTCLRTMFNKALDWEEATVNPMKGVKLAKEDNGRIRYLEEGEAQALFEELPSWLKVLVLTAIHTGLRAGELMTLVPESVDCIADVITVPAAYSKNGETRSVPLDETVKAVLKPLVKNTPKGERLFRNRQGNPHSRYGYRKAFDTALKRAGIENFHFHDLRHCFASFMAMQGVQPLALQQLMGHKDAKMTARYTHLSPSYLRDAVKTLDRWQGSVENLPHFSPHPQLGAANDRAPAVAISSQIRNVTKARRRSSVG